MPTGLSGSSLFRFAFSASDKFPEPIEKGSLTSEHFFSCNGQIEPFCAVDFRKGLKTPAFRRPLHCVVTSRSPASDHEDLR